MFDLFSQRLKSLLERMPHVRSLKAQADRFGRFQRFPSGHYYSPVVDAEEVGRRQDAVWSDADAPALPGVDLRVPEQLALMQKLSAYAAEMPFGEEARAGLRYRFTNPFFCHTDGILLYAVLRHLRPRRFIEVGSGWSTALVLDVNERFLNDHIRITCIEPDPARLVDLIGESASHALILLERPVQEIPLDRFDGLEAGDVLFIDSSHVLKSGSDVAHLLFHVLPRLRPGVWVHVHDVFAGFEYPRDWVLGGYNWNEAHAVRAFLMYNTAFRVRLFANHLHRHHPEAYAAYPMATRNHGGSLWLERVEG